MGIAENPENHKGLTLKQNYFGLGVSSKGEEGV
jgi:hypothetical protein